TPGVTSVAGGVDEPAPLDGLTTGVPALPTGAWPVFEPPTGVVTVTGAGEPTGWTGPAPEGPTTGVEITGLAAGRGRATGCTVGRRAGAVRAPGPGAAPPPVVGVVVPPAAPPPPPGAG